MMIFAMILVLALIGCSGDKTSQNKKDNSEDEIQIVKRTTKDDPDEPAEDPGRSDEDPDKPVEDPDKPGGGSVSRHPVFEIKEFGNFSDIDPKVFETSQFQPNDLVGRWYEDGWLEGYYLELYGNGTWKYFGEDERNGYYQISYSLIVLTESEYGVGVCQPMIFYNEDDNVYQMSLTPTAPEAFKTRTDPDDYVSFWREDGCRHCKDLDAFYKKKYPYGNLAGKWYPVGDHSGKQYYDITAAAHWSYIAGHTAYEVGVLEKQKDGSFRSEGGTWGEIYTFEPSDDGYLYIDGTPYEKAEHTDAPPDRTVGTFCYDNGDGYIFNEDWTYESVQGSSFDEHGTFLLIGDNVLLYDDNGYRIHVFYQNDFMDWDGEWEEEAWRKRMENRDEGDLYGESIYFQVP